MNNTKNDIKNDIDKTKTTDTPKVHERYGVKKHMSKLALASGILAILGFVIGGMAFGTAAIICGLLALNKGTNPHDKYWAISGIVLGAISVIVFL